MLKEIKDNAITTMAVILISIFSLIIFLTIGSISRVLEEMTGIQPGDWMNLLGVTLGVAIPIGITITLDRTAKKETKEEKEKHIEKIIDLILYDEITYNLKSVLQGKSEVLYDRLKRGSFPINYKVGFKFKTDEFEKIKYEIIKYDSDKVKDIIDLYSVLTRLETKRNLEDYTDVEYGEFKNIIIKNIDKYCN